MVWLAPVSRSSTGLSAVSSSSGTWERDASTTAGSRLATAVPELVMTAAGVPEARPKPRAQKASERSSMQTCGGARPKGVSGVSAAAA
jgi:hypothetical protein